MIDGADEIENVCSIDATPRISRGITVCSPPVKITNKLCSVWKLLLEDSFGNFFCKFCLEISFGNFVWKFCLKFSFGNFVWKTDRPTDWPTYRQSDFLKLLARSLKTCVKSLNTRNFFSPLLKPEITSFLECCPNCPTYCKFASRKRDYTDWTVRASFC